MDENNNFEKETPQPQQNAPQEQNVNQNTNPYTINIPQNAVRTTIMQPAKGETKFGSILTSILCFVFGLLFLAGAYLFYFDVYLSSNSSQAVAVIMFFLIYGWFTILPAIILSIIGIVFGTLAKSSVKKSTRVTSVFFIIFNTFLLLATVISLFLLGSIHG